MAGPLQLLLLSIVATATPILAPPTPGVTPTCGAPVAQAPIFEPDPNCPGAIVAFDSAISAAAFERVIEQSVRVVPMRHLPGIVLLPEFISLAGVTRLLQRTPALPEASAPTFTLNYRVFHDSYTPAAHSTAASCRSVASKPTDPDRPVIAIIDTGVGDLCSPPLAEHVWVNPGEANGTDGVDDDGNGYVDDLHGVSVLGGDHGNLRDTDGHGTIVTNSLLEALKQGTPEALRPALLFCKFAESGASACMQDLIQCLEYVAGVAEQGANIVAINLSWGSGRFDPRFEQVLRPFADRGILVVTSAGNGIGDIEATPRYPTSFGLRHVVSVAASFNGQVRSGSNYGRHTVDVAADGTSTSFAAPVVSALVGMMAAEMADLSYGERRKLLLSSGEPMENAKTVTQRKAVWKTEAGVGVASCADQDVGAILSPISRGTGFTFARGDGVRFESLAAHCASDLGAAEVEIWGDGVHLESLVLGDDPTCNGVGSCWDQKAGDGVFSARWVPPAAATYVARFVWGGSSTPRDIVIRACE